VVEADVGEPRLLGGEGAYKDNQGEKKASLVIRLPMGKGLVGACAESGAEVKIGDCQSDPRFDKKHDRKTGYTTRTVLCVPIKNNVGQVLGVVQMINKTTQRRLSTVSNPDAVDPESLKNFTEFTEDDARKIRNVCSKATAAIEKAQMFAKLQLIMDATNKINASSADLDVLVARTMSAARRLLKADRCTLFLLDQATNELYSHFIDHEAHLSGDATESTPAKKSKEKKHKTVRRGSTQSKMAITSKEEAAIVFHATKGIAGKSLLTKQSINAEDVYEDPKFNRQIDQKTGYRTKSVLCVPVMNSTGEVLGVAQMINKMNGSESISFRDQDEKVLRAFIAQVAVAMTNNQLFNHVFNSLSQNLSMIGSLPEVILAISVEGGFIESNRPLRDAFSVPMEDVHLEEHYHEWLKPFAPPEILSVIDQTFDRREEMHVDFPAPGLIVGDYTYWSCHASPVSRAYNKKGQEIPTNLFVVVTLECESSEGHVRMCQSLMDQVENQGGDSEISYASSHDLRRQSQCSFMSEGSHAEEFPDEEYKAELQGAKDAWGDASGDAAVRNTMNAMDRKVSKIQKSNLAFRQRSSLMLEEAFDDSMDERNVEAAGFGDWMRPEGHKAASSVLSSTVLS